MAKAKRPAQKRTVDYKYMLASAVLGGLLSTFLFSDGMPEAPLQYSSRLCTVIAVPSIEVRKHADNFLNSRVVSTFGYLTDLTCIP